MCTTYVRIVLESGARRQASGQKKKKTNDSQSPTPPHTQCMVLLFIQAAGNAILSHQKSRNPPLPHPASRIQPPSGLSHQSIEQTHLRRSSWRCPDRDTAILNRRRAPSMGSPSLTCTVMSTMRGPSAACQNPKGEKKTKSHKAGDEVSMGRGGIQTSG